MVHNNGNGQIWEREDADYSLQLCAVHYRLQQEGYTAILEVKEDVDGGYETTGRYVHMANSTIDFPLADEPFLFINTLKYQSILNTLVSWH
jgi:hypothetical protein